MSTLVQLLPQMLERYSGKTLPVVMGYTVFRLEGKPTPRQSRRLRIGDQVTLDERTDELWGIEDDPDCGVFFECARFPGETLVATAYEFFSFVGTPFRQKALNYDPAMPDNEPEEPLAESQLSARELSLRLLQQYRGGQPLRVVTPMAAFHRGLDGEVEEDATIPVGAKIRVFAPRESWKYDNYTEIEWVGHDPDDWSVDTIELWSSVKTPFLKAFLRSRRLRFGNEPEEPLESVREAYAFLGGRLTSYWLGPAGQAIQVYNHGDAAGDILNRPGDYSAFDELIRLGWVRVVIEPRESTIWINDVPKPNPHQKSWLRHQSEVSGFSVRDQQLRRVWLGESVSFRGLIEMAVDPESLFPMVETLLGKELVLTKAMTAANLWGNTSRYTHSRVPRGNTNYPLKIERLTIARGLVVKPLELDRQMNLVSFEYKGHDGTMHLAHTIPLVLLTSTKNPFNKLVRKKALSGNHGFWAPHMRNEPEEPLESIRESIPLGWQSIWLDPSGNDHEVYSHDEFAFAQVHHALDHQDARVAMLEDGWARISIEPKLEVIWVEHLVPLTREQENWLRFMAEETDFEVKDTENRPLRMVSAHG